MAILSSLRGPADLHGLTDRQLTELAAEIRETIIGTVARTGGHLGSSLGVVELTIALHRLLDSPRDRIVWDTGHQAYPHKLLTGRYERFGTLRQLNGIGGFPRRSESEHDIFDGGHAGTGLSIAQGLAAARDLRKGTERIAVVVGDAALMSGLSLEALNDIGQRQTNVLIVLNDNEMSISPSVGALSKYLSTIKLSPAWRQSRNTYDRLVARVPLVGDTALELSRRLRKSVVNFAQPGQLFEDLGITYIGVVPGHNLAALRHTFGQAMHLKGPVLVHVRTRKGRGYRPAETDQIGYHGAALPPMSVPLSANGAARANGKVPANGNGAANGEGPIGTQLVDSALLAGGAGTADGTRANGTPAQGATANGATANGAAAPGASGVVGASARGMPTESMSDDAAPPAEAGPRKPPNYTAHFVNELVELARHDRRIIAITAGMPTGTGLVQFEAAYPDRFFDVGICEPHAVTMATGMAMGGLRPVVAIYSTFLQRAFDQQVHDMCQNDQPVLLAVDRAGLVGEDGTSHQGMFTIPTQRQLPHLIVASPKDEQELRSLLHTALAQDHPFALHYPRDPGFGVPGVAPAVIPVGQAEVLREGDDVVIVGFGPIVARGMAVAEELASDGWSVGVINARFAKPLDRRLILDQARGKALVVTLEESVVTGGFGSAVLELLEESRLVEPAYRATAVKIIGLPADQFVDHGSVADLRAALRLDVPGIRAQVEETLAALGLTPRQAARIAEA